VKILNPYFPPLPCLVFLASAQGKIPPACRKLEWATHLAVRDGVGDQPQQRGQSENRSSGWSRLKVSGWQSPTLRFLCVLCASAFIGGFLRHGSGSEYGRAPAYVVNQSNQ
jgi:hypothetical protein